VKQRVYFFRCGITTEMSLISRRTGSVALGGTEPEVAVPFAFAFPFVPFVMWRFERSSSRRRFFEAGSKVDAGAKLQTWREIWLNSSM
jgi:hypothetical protein